MADRRRVHENVGCALGKKGVGSPDLVCEQCGKDSKSKGSSGKHLDKDLKAHRKHVLTAKWSVIDVHDEVESWKNCSNTEKITRRKVMDIREAWIKKPCRKHGQAVVSTQFPSVEVGTIRFCSRAECDKCGKLVKDENDLRRHCHLSHEILSCCSKVHGAEGLKCAGKESPWLRQGDRRHLKGDGKGVSRIRENAVIVGKNPVIKKSQKSQKKSPQPQRQAAPAAASGPAVTGPTSSVTQSNVQSSFPACYAEKDSSAEVSSTHTQSLNTKDNENRKRKFGRSLHAGIVENDCDFEDSTGTRKTDVKVKRLECPQCDTEFADNSDMRIHLGEVHMEEELCDHVLKMFPDGSDTCSECGDVWCNEGEYVKKEHVLMEHPWPGLVRQVESCAEPDIVIVSLEEMVSPKVQLPAGQPQKAPKRPRTEPSPAAKAARLARPEASPGRWWLEPSAKWFLQREAAKGHHWRDGKRIHLVDGKWIHI
jgi:uncharacterized C2H2 Zn-finger protein